MDLTPQEEVHKIGQTEYVLKEASGEAAIKWRNAEQACYEYGSEGNISKITGLAETIPLLVSMCLFERNGQGDKPVTIGQVKAWPDRIQQQLYQRAKELSNLDQPANLDALIKQRDRINERIANLSKEEDERKKRLASVSAG